MRVLNGRLIRTVGVALLLTATSFPLVPASDAAAKDVELEELGRLKRGKKNVLVKVDVGDAGLICQLKLKYTDGNADSPDDVLSNSKGICEIYFDVPDRKSVVGDALVKLKVLNKKGDEVAKTSRGFQVRDGRN